MTRLVDLAQVLRSKNAGALLCTLDMMFEDEDTYRRVRDSGAVIRAQGPLLAHINDDPSVWARLWREQVRLGVVPYYLFVERDTGARRYFEVPLERVWNIYRDAMQQVLTQLLSNAYLASPTDGEVSITARREAMLFPDANGNSEQVEALFVSVDDQGGGTPPEDQQRVFPRLYRAHKPLIEGVGDTGVGLSIAKALVEAHQGRIWVESEPGVGSRFQCAIPYTTERA